MEYVSKKLMEIGVDVGSVIARLGGNELLYLLICKKFIKDQNYLLLQTAIFEKDFMNAEIYVHTLKGVAANLGFIRLNMLCKALIDDLQSNEFLFLKQDITNLSDEYNRIISVLIEEQSFHIFDPSPKKAMTI